MKATAIRDTVIVRQIRGGSGHTTLYIRIPRKIAEALNIRAGDPLLMEVGEGGTIILRKLKPT